MKNYQGVPLQRKEHIKMYKAGKQWLFAGIATVALSAGIGAAQPASADSVDNTKADTTSKSSDNQAGGTQANSVTLPSAGSTTTTQSTAVQSTTGQSQTAQSTAAQSTTGQSQTAQSTTSAQSTAAPQSQTTQSETATPTSGVTADNSTSDTNSGLDLRMATPSNLDATNGSPTANVNRQSPNLDLTNGNFDFSKWQENASYTIKNFDFNLNDFSSTGGKFTGYITNTTPAGTQPDTQAKVGVSAMSIGIFDKNNNRITMSQMGITDPSQITGADIVYPNGTTATLNNNTRYFLDANGKRTTDMTKATDVAYYVHPNDTQTSWYQNGVGIDPGVNDQSNIQTSGSKAGYTISIHWNAPNFDTLQSQVGIQTALVSTSGGSDVQPQLTKEFYVDQNTGQQLAPMNIMGEGTTINVPNNPTNVDLSSQDYWLKNDVLYQQIRDGSSSTTKTPLYHINTPIYTAATPQALVHEYSNQAKATIRARVINVSGVANAGKDLTTPDVRENTIGTTQTVQAPVIPGYKLVSSVTGTTPDKGKGDSPSLANAEYAASQASQTVKYVSPTDATTEGQYYVTYLYAPATSQINTNFIDMDNNNSVVKTSSDSGTSGNAFGSSNQFSQTKANLLAAGYVVDHEDSALDNPSNIHFTDGNQTFNVYLKHATAVITNATPQDGVTTSKSVNRVINYVDSSGNTVAPSVTQKADFTRSVTIDKVTGTQVSATDWASTNNQLPAVTSPTIANMNTDTTSVPATTVSGDSSDQTVNVVYGQNQGTWSYEVVDDDNNGESLGSGSYSGVVGTDDTEIANTLGAVTQQAKDLGYTIISPSSIPDSMEFTTPDNHLVIHLGHATVQVDKDHPQTSGTNITPNGTAQYPSDVNNLTKTYTQTIDLVDKSGNKLADSITKTVTADRTLVIDAVTGQVKSDQWKAEGDFPAVTAPQIAHYTPEQAASNPVANPTGDDHQSIVYDKLGNYSATVSYIDDTTGKTITNATVPGEAGSTVDYEDQTDTFKAKGYDIVSNNVPQNGIKLDKDGQSFEVHMKHATADVTPDTGAKAGDTIPGGSGKYPDAVNDLSKDLTLTVHYTDQNGKKLADDKTTTVKETRNITVDKVTGDVLTTGDWKKSADTYPTITSPSIPGYSTTQSDVSGQPVTDTNSETTVKYTQDNTKTTVTYHDDDTNTDLTTDTLGGQPGSPLNYTDKTNDYKAKGYDVVSNDIPANATFGDKGQAYTVHLKHGSTNVTPDTGAKAGDTIPGGSGKYPDAVNDLSKDLTLTVHYTDQNGKKLADDKTATVHETRDLSIDKVTGQVIKTGDWQKSADTYPSIDTPTISGYTPDKTSVSGEKVADTNSDVTVKYTLNPTKTTVVYHDDDTNTNIATDDLDGQPGSPLNYTDKTNAYKAKGYEIVSNDIPADGKFSDRPQTFTIHMKHATVTVDTSHSATAGTDIPDGSGKYPDAVNSLSKTVTQTVDYQDDNGKTLQPSTTKSLTFNRTLVIDKVTGAVTSDKWSAADGNSFPTVNAPSISGYTAESTGTKAVDDVTQDTPNDHQVIKYSREAASATIDFVDGSDGNKVLDSTVLNGKDGETVKPDTADKIKALQDKGYVVSTNTVPSDGINLDPSNKHYTVTLTHGTVDVDANSSVKGGDTISGGSGKFPDAVNDTSKTTTRTIHYVESKGNKVADDAVQTVKYGRTITVDKVTGQVVKTGNWTTSSDSYPAVTSPSIANMKPDTATVSAKKAGDSNEAVTVTYTATNASATIDFVDGNDGNKVIDHQDVTGDAGNTVKPDLTSKLKDLEAKGYVVDVNNVPSDGIKLDSNGTHYTVILKHGTQTVDKDHPVDGVETTKTVNRVITYVDEAGDTVAPAVTQTVTFNRSVVIDKVTGKQISATDYQADKTSFDAVTSPTVAGLTPDQTEVKAADVKATDGNTNVVVHYTKNAVTPTSTSTTITPTAPITPTETPSTGVHAHVDNSALITVAVTGALGTLAFALKRNKRQ